MVAFYTTKEKDVASLRRPLRLGIPIYSYIPTVIGTLFEDG